MDLILAPCPADALVSLLNERFRFKNIRLELKALVERSEELAMIQHISKSSKRTDSSYVSTAAGTDDAELSDSTNEVLSSARSMLNMLMFDSNAASLRCRFYLARLLQTTGQVFRSGALQGLVPGDKALAGRIDKDVQQARHQIEMVA